MNIFGWIGIALTASVLALTVRQHQPVFGLLTAMAAGLCLLWTAAQTLGGLASSLREMAETAEISSEIYLPVVKAVGIAAAVRVACAICKDAGQNALSVKLELLGAAAALCACLPLFEQLLSLVAGMLE